jgi:beta-mannosidase
MMRATNSYGALVWQLNENWPTGGWGCVEYGPRKGMKGQVVGGRWKPLMYLLRRRLFRDSIVACGQNGRCFSRNDSMNSTNVRVIFAAWKLRTNRPLRALGWNHSHGPGRSTHFFSLPDDFANDADVILIQTTGHQPAQYSVDTEAFLWKVPRELAKLAMPVTFSIILQTSAANESVHLVLRSDSLALYVFLSTAVDGHFSENAFHLRPNIPMMITFTKTPSDDSIDMALFRKTLRLNHLGKTGRLGLKMTAKTAIT